MGAEIDILIADDVAAVQFVVANDRIGEPRASIGAAQAPSAEEKVRQIVRQGRGAGVFGQIQPNRLIDCLHIAEGAGCATRIRWYIAAAAVERQSRVTVAIVVEEFKHGGLRLWDAFRGSTEWAGAGGLPLVGRKSPESQRNRLNFAGIR